MGLILAFECRDGEFTMSMDGEQAGVVFAPTPPEKWPGIGEFNPAAMQIQDALGYV
jgi:hypothetical protein